MIKTIQGDILNLPGDNWVICHQVNCKGVMGAGLALQIREKYPAVYNTYKKIILANRRIYKQSGVALLGKMLGCRMKNGTVICNLFAQNNYGRTGSYTDYNAFRKSLENVIEYMKIYGYTKVAIPDGIGAGLAGGNKSIIHGIIYDVFSHHPELECYLVIYNN